MGQKQAKPIEPVADPSADLSLLEKVHLSVAPPSAVVIGAGFAGVQIARDLATSGFSVDVLDAAEEVGGREVHHCIPVVGYVPPPTLVSINVRQCLLRGIFANAQPLIMSREHSWDCFLSARIHQWLWGRFCCRSGADATVIRARQLAHHSREVVEEMVATYPQLGVHIKERSGKKGFIRSGDAEGGEGDETQLWIDPVGWTKDLSTICKEQHGVRFLMGERVTSLFGDVRKDSEFISTVFSVDSNATHHPRQYDVVVVAAGVETRALVAQFMQLPLLPLSGYRVDFPQSSSVAADNSASGGRFVDRILQAVVDPSEKLDQARSTFWGKFVSKNEVTVLHRSSPDSELSLFGLYSFSSKRDAAYTTPDYILKALASQLRVNGSPVKTGEQIADVLLDVANDVSSAPPTSATPRTYRYVRCVSPDGIPVASVCGNTFNGFVCAGFGGHAATFAPGAARYLADIITKKTSPSSTPATHFRLGMHKELPVVETKPWIREGLERVETGIYDSITPLVTWLKNFAIATGTGDDLAPPIVRANLLKYVGDYPKLPK